MRPVLLIYLWIGFNSIHTKTLQQSYLDYFAVTNLKVYTIKMYVRAVGAGGSDRAIAPPTHTHTPFVWSLGKVSETLFLRPWKWILPLILPRNCFENSLGKCLFKIALEIENHLGARSHGFLKILFPLTFNLDLQVKHSRQLFKLNLLTNYRNYWKTSQPCIISYPKFPRLVLKVLYLEQFFLY